MDPKLRHVGHDMCVAWLQLRIHFANLGPPLRPKLGPTSQVGPGPSCAQPDMPCVFTAVSNLFLACCAMLRHWARLGPNLGGCPPHRTKLRHVRPDRTCAQMCQVAHVGTQLGRSLAQVARARRKLGPSSAHVILCSTNLRPRTAKLDPSRPRLGQVGPCSSPRIPKSCP